MQKKLKQKGALHKNKLIVEPLSDRVLYSADPLGLSGDIIAPEFNADFNEEYGVILEDTTTSDSLAEVHVVFVDTNVLEYRQIIDALISSSGNDAEFVVYSLNNADTIDRVTDNLTNHNNLAAIHFITHGTDANVRLGSSELNSESLSNYTDDLNAWKNALHKDGDILFYGCNLAATDQGKELITQIAIATQADVAASNNLTGHESFNADWQLEFSVGDVDKNDSLLINKMQHWESILAITSGQTITVTTIEDTQDGDTSSPAALAAAPGDDGFISLREAIVAANSTPNDVDTIVVEKGTYALENGPLGINSPITIEGAGHLDNDNKTTIDGKNSDRVFYIDNASQVTLKNIEITDGYKADYGGGGIFARNTDLILDGVTVKNSKANQGGGIFVEGSTVNIKDSYIWNNETAGGVTLEGGGLFATANTVVNIYNSNFTSNKLPASTGSKGGAIYSAGTVNINTTLFDNNEAEYGGAVFIQTLNAQDTEFTGNNATVGGAIFLSGSGEITRSLIHVNSAENTDNGKGGGISHYGDLAISDTTISGNRAKESGAAISTGSGDLTISRSTIIGNRGESDRGALWIDESNTSHKTITIQGSIFSRNTTLEDIANNIDNTNNIHKTVISAGHNLTDNTFATIQSTDQVNVNHENIGIEENLSDNGGAKVFTVVNGQIIYHTINSHEIFNSGLAYNNGENIGSDSGITDATGAQRDAYADIGAYEFRSSNVSNGPTVVTNNGLSLDIGDIATIDITSLQTIDPDNSPSELTYTVNNFPINGVLSVYDEVNEVYRIIDSNNPTFTQADINARLLQYEHQTQSSVDEFRFSVVDSPDNNSTNLHIFQISASDSVNDAPVLNASADLFLNPIVENLLDAQNPGTSVKELLQSVPAPASANWTPTTTDDSYWISDADIGALEGIAVIKANDIHRTDTAGNPKGGVFQFKTDPNSPNWSTINPTDHMDFKEVSDKKALLLKPESLIRFVPNNDFSGISTIEFRAHDWTTGGQAGDYRNFENGDGAWKFGGPHATSSQVETASLEVKPINDEPPVIEDVTLTQQPEDTIDTVITATRIGSLYNDPSKYSDNDYADHASTPEIFGIAITSNNTTDGIWRYSTDSTNWHDIGPVSEDNALVLSKDTVIKFVPNIDFNGQPTDPLVVHAIDSLYEESATVGNTKETIKIADNTVFVSVAKTISAQVTPTNDAPKLSTIESVAAQYVENNSGLGITGNLSVTDVDDTNLRSATISITSNFTPAEDSLLFINQAEINGAYDATTGVLQLNGTASKADYLDAIKSVAYTNSSDNPTTNTRTVSIEVTDNEPAPSNTLSRDIEIISVNDAPSIGNLDTTPVSYIENSAPVALTSSITINDADNNQVTSAIISITSNFRPAEDILISEDLDLLGITGNYDSNTGELELIGTASKTDYATAIESIKYQNLSDNPTANTRTISYMVNDGALNSIPANKNLEIVPVNDAPTISPSLTVLSMTPVDEDSTPDGELISDIIGDKYSDIDSEITGIAITNNPYNHLTEGYWQYAVEDTFQLVGLHNNNSALILDKDTKLRFKPAWNFYGIPAPLTVHVIDSSFDTNGYTDRSLGYAIPKYSNLNNTGGDTPFSESVELHSPVNLVGDAPVIQDITISDYNNVDQIEDPITDSPVKLKDLYFNDGDPTTDDPYEDVDGTQSLFGIAVSANAAIAADEGRWEYSIDGITNWADIGTPNANEALVLGIDSSIRFTPNPDYSGTPGKLEVFGIDGIHTNLASTSSDSNRITINTNAPDMYFSQQKHISTSVTPVADAPTIIDVTLPSQDEDNSTTAYLIANIFPDASNYSDADGTAMYGIAVTDNPSSTKGTWQYSVDGNDWNNINTVSEDFALVLSKDTFLKFAPAAHYNGPAPDLQVKAIDGTYTGGSSISNKVADGRVKIVTTDSQTATLFSEARTISVEINAINDSPSIIDLQTISIQEDANNQTGSLVADLVGITDIDTDTLGGIAITANAANVQSEGRWQYQVGNNAWKDIINVSPVNALLLDSTTKIRFEPLPNYNGTPGSLTIHAVDSAFIGNFSNTSDITADLQSYGSNTHFSPPTQLNTIVNPVEDSPTIDSAILSDQYEDVAVANPTTISELFSDSHADNDGNAAFYGVAITANNASATDGTWEYSIDGTVWYKVNSVNQTNALVIDADTYIGFRPEKHFSGTPTPLELKAIDGTYFGSASISNSVNGRISIDTNSSTTQFSDSKTLSVTVLPTNDAPVTTSTVLNAIYEDNTNPTGETVFNLWNSITTDIDPNSSLKGIAITGNPETDKGAWEYRTASGGWQSIGPVAVNNALILDVTSLVRFLPAANYFGNPPPITVHAIDDTFGGNFNSYTNIPKFDFKTPFSAGEILETSIIAVNDAPSLDNDVTLANQLEDAISSPISISQLFENQYNDIDGINEVPAIVITSNPASDLDGAWDYSTNGTDWHPIGSVSNSSALILSKDSQIKFSPATNFYGKPSELSIRALDSDFNGDVTIDGTPETIDISNSVIPLSEEHAISIEILPVNDAPSGSNKTITTAEDTTYIFSEADFGYSDSVESNIFTGLTVKSLPVTGTLTNNGTPVGVNAWIDIADIQSGHLTYSPTDNENGTALATWDFQVSDNGGSANGGFSQDQTQNTITIDVTPVNDAPTVSNGFVSTTEGETVSISLNHIGFADLSDNHTIDSIIFDALPSIGSLQLNSATVITGQLVSASDIDAGLLTYTAPLSNTGSSQDELRFRAIDNGGTTNNGLNTSAQGTLSFGITPPANTPPTSEDKLLEILEDTTHQFSANDFVFTDTADGHPFHSVVITAVNTEGSLTLAGTEVVAGTTIQAAELVNLEFTPAQNANGSTYATIQFNVTDNGTIAGGGSNISATSNTITIDVLGVNDAPTTGDGFVSAIEGEAVSINLNHIGFADLSDNHTIDSIIIDALPSIGSLQLNSATVITGQLVSASDIDTGLLTYTAPLSNTGSSQDELRFRAIDNGGTTNNGLNTSAQGTLSFGITPPANTPPTSEDKLLEILEDTTHQFSANDFVFTDTADGHAFHSVVITAVNTEGSLTLAGTEVVAGTTIQATELGNLKFTPAQNANGSTYATIQFNVTDNGTMAGGGSNISAVPNTITIDVLGVNDAPQAADGFISTIESQPYTLSLDDFNFSDPKDSDDLSSVIVEVLPSTGVLAHNGIPVFSGDQISAADITAGALTFTPAITETPTQDSFNFKVVDTGGIGNNGIDTSGSANTITIEVLTTNDRPTSAHTTITLSEDTSVALTTQDFAFTDDNDAMAGIEIIELPSRGTLLLNNNAVPLNELITTAELDNNALVFKPAANDHAADYATMTFRVADNGNNSTGKHLSADSWTMTFNVQAVNDAPTDLNISGDLLITENEIASNVGEITFSDIDDIAHTISVNDERFEITDNQLSLKSGISIDFETEQSIPMQITVQDASGATDVYEFLLAVTNVNEAPSVNKPIETQAELSPFEFSIPEDIFSDPDNEPLTLSATLADGSPLPEWLQFNPSDGTFSVNNDSKNGETVEVTVYATDANGLAALTQFELGVVAPEPVFAPAFATQPTIIVPEVGDGTAQILDADSLISEPEADEADEAEEETAEVGPQQAPIAEEQFEAAEVEFAEILIDDKDSLREVVKIKTDASTVISVIQHRDNLLMTNTSTETASLLQTAESNAIKLKQQHNAYVAMTLNKLAKQADASHTEINSAAELETKVLATSVTLSSGLSVGYILWLLRGGTLLASMMASIPAWRAIDPLPILDGMGDDDDSDTETLESMVEADEDEDAANDPEQPDTELKRA